MRPERLQQIQELYLSARDRDPATRTGFLAQACGGDKELRQEVESLLGQDSGDVMNRPAVEVAAKLLDSGHLSPGVQIGAYRIESQLGAGGMGEVFRAVDTRLGRAVAIKTCREQFSERFHREARAISSLNHPHICTLYDVGPSYLVMELVEGETLADRLKRGRLSIEQTVQYGSQIADALAAAHAKGIIHRDLKPGNIMLAKSGVKVLDFGLAKSSQDETLTASQVILGTPAYMAPEQRNANGCDARTDIYALGLVLCEMATANKSRVLTDLPPQLGHIVERCLVEDPDSRWQAASDVKAELDWVARTPSPGSLAKAPSRWLAWAVAAAFAVAFAAVSLVYFRVYFRAAPAGARVTYSTVSPPENASSDWNAPVVSPDGRSIALWRDGKDRLWLRRLDSPAWQPLPGTEHAMRPFWSPDSRSLGFFADGKLKRIEVTGGPPETLADAPIGVGGSWSPQGVIVFAPNSISGLQKVAATGGQPAPATTLQGTDDYSHRFPWFLPDGKHFLFQGQASRMSTLRIGALDSREMKTVGRASSNGVYSSGYLLYLRENTLMAQPFDQARLTTSGEAVPIAQQVAGPIDNAATRGEFSVSGERLLAYKTGAETSRLQLKWFDRAGRQMGTLGDPSDFLSLEFSPDHTNVAVTLGSRNSDIWIYEVARGLPARFTSSTGSPQGAVWSPDGRSLAYRVLQHGVYGLYRKAVDGSGSEEQLYADDALNWPASWSPDGRFLLFWRIDPKTGYDIWALPLERDAARASLKPFPWLVTPFNEVEGKFSLDGRWVAYCSDESNPLYEVYVAPFPGPGTRRQVSAGGGIWPRWRADGKEIFYTTRDGVLMAAEVSAKGTSIEVGAIRPLGVRVPTDGYFRYDVSADGQRFLVAAPVGQKSSPPLTLVENWTELLKKK